MKKKIFLLFACLCVLANLNAQDTEFWFSASDVAKSHSDSPVFFVFSNPSKVKDANVRITCHGGAPAGSAAFEQNFVVSARGFYKLDFTDWPPTPLASLVETPAALAGTVSNYGIHITSDVKILVYYMINANTQRDIYSLKGAPALGTYFITPFMKQEGNYFEQRPHAIYNMGSDEIEIVATQPNTTVTVDLKKRCMLGTNAHLETGVHTFNFTHAGQTLTLREDTVGATNTVDAIALTKNTGTLAGTVIRSDKPIAVTQTEDCFSAVRGPLASGSTDVVGDQLVPVDMVGKRYVVIRGYSTVGERVDFVATQPNTTITVHYNGGTLASPTLNTGDMWYVDMSDINGTASDIFVDATEPVYCYQHTATNGELGGAIIPSMYSISQQQIAFYQSPGMPNQNNIFLVFREGTDTAFTISYGTGAPRKLSDVVGPITPMVIPGSIANEWRYANIGLPASEDNKMALIRNDESTFSLGYFNGVGSVTAGYGYLSGFGSFAFDPDTFWRCSDKPVPISLVGGYALSYLWSYYPDTGYTTPTATWTTPSIKARQKGMYVLEMNQDPRIIKDTVWVLDMVWNASIKRKPNKPAKISVPQQFDINMNPSMLNMPTLSVEWTFEGGNPSTSNVVNPKVVWNSTGPKKVTLRLSATASSGAYEVTCVIIDLD